MPRWMVNLFEDACEGVSRGLIMEGGHSLNVGSSNSTQARVIWEEGLSTVKVASNWSVDRPGQALS